MSGNQVNRLNKQAIQALTPKQIKAIPLKALQAMTFKQLAQLNQKQINTLPRQVINDLNDKQLRGLGLTGLNLAQSRPNTRTKRDNARSIALERRVIDAQDFADPMVLNSKPETEPESITFINPVIVEQNEW